MVAQEGVPEMVAGEEAWVEELVVAVEMVVVEAVEREAWAEVMEVD